MTERDELKLEILDQFEDQGAALERQLERLVRGKTGETEDRDERRARLAEGLIGLREYTGQHGFIADVRAELESSKRDREALAEARKQLGEAYREARVHCYSCSDLDCLRKGDL